MKQIFSVPFNPYIDEEFFNTKFIPFLEKNKDHIFDLYATIHAAPFTQDSMGGIFTEDDSLVNNFFYLQETYGIRMTATFNNTVVSPDINNLKTFIESLKPLYEYGLRSIILPHQHWLRLGLIQKEFPDLFIKNTIVSRLYDLQDIYTAAEAGFDYIHIDRTVMRDQDTLDRIPKLRETIKDRFGKDIMLSLLVNESCIGKCPVMNEHYIFNNTRTEKIKPYFTNPISTISCNKWSKEDPAYYLKIANVMPLKSHYDHYLKYFDTLKFHGRDNLKVWQDSMQIIDNYVDGNEVLFQPHIWHYEQRLGNKFEEFVEKTRNCKFQCWECSWCDDHCIDFKGDFL